MYNSENQQNLIPMVDYYPAELKIGKRWYINFYVKDPISGKMIRKQMKCNRTEDLRERKRWAKKKVHEINMRLASGWNPLIAENYQNAYTSLFDAIEKYLSVKGKEFRPNSLRSYKSFIKTLKSYVIEKKNEDMMSFQFTKVYASSFMIWLNNKKNLSPKTHNNYLVGYKAMFNWMKQYKYIVENPFDDFKKKKEQHKSRKQILEPNVRNVIKTYLKKNDYHLYVMSQLCFHCLIRPREMVHIKGSHINLDDQSIFIPGSIAKNGNDRFSTIPNVIMHDLRNLDLSYKNAYLFSTNFQPGSKLIHPTKISKEWSKMRKAIKLDDKFKFYSLRDAGIIQKIKDGIPLDEVMYQADHSSLEITNKYAKVAKPKLSDNIKNNTTAF